VFADGRYKEALDAYDDYLKRYPGSTWAQYIEKELRPEALKKLSEAKP
jgi:outer membrane protein assembly factor BamD (BamD/ComL family)